MLMPLINGGRVAYFSSQNRHLWLQTLFVMLSAVFSSFVLAIDEPVHIAPTETTVSQDSLAVTPVVEQTLVPVIQASKNLTTPIVDCISRDAEGQFLGWIDTQHCMLSNRTTSTAQWFDGLFGHGEEINDARIRLRVINDLNWFEGDGVSSNIRFRASAVLPNAKKRLRLIVSDDEDTLHPERNQLSSNSIQPKTSAAIRWMPDYISRVKYSFDIGLHSTPDIYGRIRAQRAWQMSSNSVMRFTETLRYGVQEEGKSLTQLEFERLLNDKTVFRLSNALQYWQNEELPIGLRWSQDWTILHRLGQQKTISYGIVFEGIQQPNWRLESDTLFVLYRQSFWRPWLYYEVEPHLSRAREQHWDMKSAIIFRVEANFGG